MLKASKHFEQASKLVFVKKNLDSEDLERKRNRFTFGEKEKEDPVVGTSTSSSAITANNCTSVSGTSTSIASAPTAPSTAQEIDWSDGQESVISGFHQVIAFSASEDSEEENEICDDVFVQIDLDAINFEDEVKAVEKLLCSYQHQE